MSISKQTAKHFRDVHFGGNWTTVNVKDTVKDITWQQATTELHSLNTIAKLVYHINYYVTVVLRVLHGEPLKGSDKESFNCPPITSQEDWDDLVNKTLTEAEQFAVLVEQLPDSKFWEIFSDPKYGDYYRNINGIIEHTHYHLGQIVVIKKILEDNTGTR